MLLMMRAPHPHHRPFCHRGRRREGRLRNFTIVKDHDDDDHDGDHDEDHDNTL